MHVRIYAALLHYNNAHPYIQVLYAAGCAISPIVLQNTVAIYSAVTCVAVHQSLPVANIFMQWEWNSYTDVLYRHSYIFTQLYISAGNISQVIRLIVQPPTQYISLC